MRFRPELCICLASFLFILACMASDILLTKDCNMETALTILELSKQAINKARELHVGSPAKCERNNDVSYLNAGIYLLQDGTKMVKRYGGFPPMRNQTAPGKTPPYPQPMDCLQVLKNGEKKDGIYTIYLRHRNAPKTGLKVVCDMQTAGGGWTLLQRRGNFSKPQTFDLNWQQYQEGFGDLNGEFWIGNDNIHYITNQGDYTGRFDFKNANGARIYSQYEVFWVEGKATHYKLHIDKYSGTAGDNMQGSNNHVFQTPDSITGYKGQGIVCPGGFWFSNCTNNLNGVLRPASTHASAAKWNRWTGTEGIAATEMKVRRKE